MKKYNASPLILCIETSTKACSIAICKGNELITEKSTLIERSHSKHVLSFINQIFQETSFSIKDIEAVAVSSGPGSYTGLRIGLSIAKGLCYGLDIPLISINSLDIMSYQVCSIDRPEVFLCSTIDARRNEVYCSVAKRRPKHDLEMHTDSNDLNFDIIEPAAPKIITSNSFSNILNCSITPNTKMLFFGDGAKKCIEIIDNPNAVLVENIMPMAQYMVALAINKYYSKTFESISTFEPLYLKSPIDIG